MSWDIVIFNSKQKINSVAEIDESQLLSTDFCEILEKSFKDIITTENHIEIKGKGFSIDYFQDNEKVSNKLMSLYGENALYEIIELAKRYNWQIYDSGIDGMIDLENPIKNGYENHIKYIKQIMKKE
jgi:hypothetical protein